MSSTGGSPGLRGAEMAAYVLMSIDEDAASRVLRNMDELDIAVITDAMAAMKPVQGEQAYQIYTRLMADLESAGAMSPGGFKAFRSVLVKAFGETRAREMIERIMRSGTAAMDVLSKIDSKSLVEQVRNERPQLIAVLLAQMSKTAAVETVSALPEALAMDVLLRFARLDAIRNYAVVELKAMLSEILGKHVTASASSMGGARQAADVLNGMGAGFSDRALERIRETDPDLADKIRENMFTFDDLSRLPDTALQLVILGVDQAKRAPALRAASPQMRERILKNVTTKEAAILRDEIDNGPMVTRADAQHAQRAYIDSAMALAQEGRISLGEQEDML